MKRARYLLADAFPPPTGLYDVGHRTLPLAAARPLLDTPRVELFYPVEPAVAKTLRPRAPSRHPDVSIADARPASPKDLSFPVVIYFSGWPGNAIDNYSLICELVSHGMLVATIIYPAAAGGMDYSSDAASERTIQEANRLVAVRAGDASELLDRLEFDRAAIIGFSFGGAVAAEAALLDKRFCAAVNIDGRPWGRSLHEGVPCAYLFLGGDRPLPSAADLNSSNPDRRHNAELDVIDIQELSRNLTRHGGIHITVSKVDHLDFIDGALRWSRRRWLRKNRIDPRWVLEVTRSHVCAFLKNSLGMPPVQLPGAASSAAGIRIEIYLRP